MSYPVGLRRVLMLAAVAVLAAIAVAQPNAPTAAPNASGSAELAAGGSPELVYILPIHGQINKLTADVLERGLTEARDAGADVVVFDVDTPGGLVSAAIDISGLIKNMRDIHTVAWVNPEAISAGSLISLACDEIVVAPRSKIGDCAAIMVGPQGLQSLGETERAKIDSYILAEFRDSAQANDYPLVLCESMVTLGPAIYRIRHAADDKVEYVYADQLPKYGLNENDANTGDANNASQSEGWKIDKLVLRERSLLTMLDDEAIEYGFATATIDTQTELLEHLGVADARVVRHEQNWSEVLVGYLTSPIIQGLLTIILLMGLYSEMQAPGIGIAGAIALLAGAILLGAPYLAGMAQWWEIVLIIVGFGLLATELLVVPGFGFIGITGIMCVFVGLLLSIVPNEIGPGVLPQLPATWDALLNGILTLLVAFTLSTIGMAILTRYFGRIPFVSRLMLTGGESTALADAPGDAPDEVGIVNVGDAGLALNDLRPAGRAQFDRRTVDVVTVGPWIESGSGVRVIQIRGNRIVVEETPT